MRLIWIHRRGADRDGDSLNRHYLVDELSDRVMGAVDEPGYPFLCYYANVYGSSVDGEFTTLETAKAFLEAQAMIGKRDKDYSVENLETQHGDAKPSDVKSEVKE